MFLHAYSTISSVRQVAPDSELLRITTFKATLSDLVESAIRPPVSADEASNSFFECSKYETDTRCPYKGDFASFVIVSCGSLSCGGHANYSFHGECSLGPYFSLPGLRDKDPATEVASIFHSTFQYLVSSTVTTGIDEWWLSLSILFFADIYLPMPRAWCFP